MTDKDLYKVLGTPRDASAADLKKAFRRLARQHHPDINPDSPDAEEKFKEASYAWSVLGDPDKRELYDKHGHAGLSDTFKPGQSDWGNFRWPSGGGLDDILGDMFGQKASSKAPSKPAARAEDIEVTLRIPMSDALSGFTTEVGYTRRAPCSRCSGQGAEPGTRVRVCGTCNGLGRGRIGHGPMQFSQVCGACGGVGQRLDSPCVACKGHGVAVGRASLKVKVPKGVDSGGRVRVRGKGHSDRRGQAGDLYVRFLVDNDTSYERKGRDLYVKAPITVGQAILGGVIEVESLSGTVRMTIPPGTDSGRRLRLKGKGVEDGQGVGDLYVSVRIVVPSKVDDEARALIERFAEIHPDVEP